MKKRCSAESRAFSANSHPALFFVLLLLSAVRLTAQTPINGLCRFNSTEISPGANHLYPLNYNQDSYTDLAVYYPGKKSLELYKGLPGGKFVKTRSQTFGIQITSLLALKDNMGRTKSFVLASRSARSILWGQFSRDGMFITRKTFKLNGYPEYLSTSDLDSDSNPEVIVSGASLPGMQVLDPVSGRKVKLIDPSQPYFANTTLDLNGDEFPDAAAYSPFQKGVALFLNDYKGGFRFARVLHTGNEPGCLISFDINLDGFQDILFTAGNSIHIFQGDSAGSYRVTRKINCFRKADKLIAGDFNRDGTIDLVYLNHETSSVGVLFADNIGQFHDETDFYSEPGISDISSFYSRFVTGFAALSVNGNVAFISKLLSFQDGNRITFGGSASQIVFPDFGEDGVKDILVPDPLNKRLKLILRNKDGSPEYMYTLKTNTSFTGFRYLTGKENAISLLLYSDGGRAYEFVSATIDRKKLASAGFVGYAPGGILAVSTPHTFNNSASFSIASVKQGSTYFEHLTYENMKLSSAVRYRADSLFESVDFDGTDTLALWYKSGSRFTSTITSVNALKNGIKYKNYFLNGSDLRVSAFLNVNSSKLRESTVFSVFHGAAKNIFTLHWKDSLYSFRESRLDNLSVTDIGHIAVADQKREDSRRLMIYDSKNGYVYAAGFLFAKNKLILRKVAEVESAEGIFHVNLYPYKNFIVCSNRGGKYFSVYRI